MKYFAIGNCNKYYIYLIISFFCELITDLFFALNPSNKEKPTRIFPFKAKIKDHNLLENFIRIASIFFGGIILYLFEKKNKRKTKGRLTIKDYEKIKLNLFHEKDSSITINLLLIGVIFSLYIILKDFIDLTHIHVGFWSLEICYICIISYFIFKIKIYIHKKLAMIIMVLLTILELTGFFLPMTKHENLENMDELTDKNIFDITIIKFGTYAIPLLFLAFEIKNFQRDFCWIKAKYLMDARSISPYKIFITIGTIGFIFIIIFFSIFTYVPCKSFNNINKINDTFINIDTGEHLQLNKEYCSLTEYDDNTKTLYLLYDSMKLISQEYSNTDKETMLEIFLIIPLLFIINLINEVSRLIIVQYLDPNNILIYKNFLYFFERIIQIIINKGDEQYLTYTQFFLTEIEELLSIVSNMIYIEVLELKFCGLDYELKKNISRRGAEDIYESIDSMGKDTESSIDMPENESMSELTSKKSLN